MEFYRNAIPSNHFSYMAFKHLSSLAVYQHTDMESWWHETGFPHTWQPVSHDILIESPSSQSVIWPTHQTWKHVLTVSFCCSDRGHWIKPLTSKHERVHRHPACAQPVQIIGHRIDTWSPDSLLLQLHGTHPHRVQTLDNQHVMHRLWGRQIYGKKSH